MPNGFIIAGTHSGCGKTTITLGLMAALKKRGLKVQPFKAGPDFIDTGLHRLITGRHSINLDIWMCGEEYVKDCFYKYSTDADIAVVEGVMGMYDGEHNTAKLAGLLNLPVILVVDAYGMAESAGAIVRGFASYSPIHRFTDSPIRIAGVIFNRVASDNHFNRLKDSLQDVMVLGYLPRDLDFEIPHRHLGLTVAEETPLAKKNIAKLADSVLEHIDVEKIIEQQSPSPYDTGQSIASYSVIPAYPRSGGFAEEHRESFLTPSFPLNLRGMKGGYGTSRNDRNAIIAVAYDKAFCFYYEDNFDLLRDAGAETITFSPLSDANIPDNADAVYIGGGYPELYAGELSKNMSLLKSLKEWSDAGRPLYAECGGLMYLSQGIRKKEYGKWKMEKMAGIFPFEMQLRDKLSRLGYREIELKDDCILGRKGDKLRGHEFHYSEINDRAQAASIYVIKNNHGELVNASGYKFKNTLASYIHVHFASNLNIAKNFMEFIREQKWKA